MKLLHDRLHIRLAWCLHDMSWMDLVVVIERPTVQVCQWQLRSSRLWLWFRLDRFRWLPFFRELSAADDDAVILTAVVIFKESRIGTFHNVVIARVDVVVDVDDAAGAGGFNDVIRWSCGCGTRRAPRWWVRSWRRCSGHSILLGYPLDVARCASVSSRKSGLATAHSVTYDSW